MDRVGDFLIRIKNAYMARQKETRAPYAKICEKIAELLLANGYLAGIKIEGEKRKEIVLSLKYIQKRPAITETKRVSKLGRRVYGGWEEIPRTRGGMGMTILSTSKGIMSGKTARKEKLGGEVLAQIW